MDFSSYPTERIAKNSHDYRPLGLGYANLGTLLMLGIPYDSDTGRAGAGALTAHHERRRLPSLGRDGAGQGALCGFPKNREPMLRVIAMHREAAYAIGSGRLSRRICVLPQAADWDEALRLGREARLPNAQTTVLRPTGTIGLLMDCDTTGIEPDFSLVKFKKLAGGGYFKIVNQSVPEALRRMGYAEAELQEIVAYVSGTNTLLAAPHVNRATLKEKGLTDDDLAKVEAAIPSVFDLELAFGPWILGDEAYDRLGVGTERGKPGFSLLKHLGFSAAQVEEANETIIGRMTVEGAPYLGKSTTRSSIARTGADARASGFSPHGAYQDDGRHAAVPLRCDLQDGQPAE